MSVPTTIFIDTNIFDSARYDFSSSRFVELRALFKDRDLTLLLPDPIQREIHRHIDELSKSALKSLQDAERRAPFLRKSRNWPLQDTNSWALRSEIKRAAESELQGFLSLFNVQELGYETVDLPEIMDWYDRSRAPFGKGKKAKEFPDALALASLAAHSESESTPVAIISRDQDFKKACDHYPHLFYYSSLAVYAESLQLSDTRVMNLRQLLDDSPEALSGAIESEFIDSMNFIIEANWDGDVEDVTVEELYELETHIIALGENECSLSFDAKIGFSAYVSYDDLETAVYEKDFFMPLFRIEGTVYEEAWLGGIVKATLAENLTSIDEVYLIEFDTDYVEIASTPDEGY